MAWHGRFLIMAIIGLASFWAQSALALNVPVDACQPVASGIQIKRDLSNTWQTLANGCRDAGHGLRNYTLQCLSTTQYSVGWTECDVSSQTSVPVHMPATVSTPTIQQPIAVTPVQVSPVANACSNHGWLHGDHCDCNVGYYAVGFECRALPTTSVAPVVTTVSQPAVTVTNHTQPAVSISPASTVQCSGHGWIHGDHCHCDAGYYAAGAQCLALPTVSTNSASTAVVKNTNSTATVNKSTGAIAQSASKALGVTTKTVLECGGHGWLHGDHCDCNAGYYAVGLECRALPGTIQVKTDLKKTAVVNQVARVIEVPQPISNTVEVIQCGGHGNLHGDHCDCDAGYLAEGQNCVALPVREVATYLATNGRSYKAEDFWASPLSLFAYDFAGKTIVHWEGAQGDYDGFLIYVNPGNFVGSLDAYQPIWLSRRQYSFAYDSTRLGQHTMYVFPYITLASGEVRRLEPGGVVRWFEPGQSSKLSKWQIFLNKFKFK